MLCGTATSDACEAGCSGRSSVCSVQSWLPSPRRTRSNPRDVGALDAEESGRDETACAGGTEACPATGRTLGVDEFGALELRDAVEAGLWSRGSMSCPSASLLLRTAKPTPGRLALRGAAEDEAVEFGSTCCLATSWPVAAAGRGVAGLAFGGATGAEA